MSIFRDPEFVNPMISVKPYVDGPDALDAGYVSVVCTVGLWDLLEKVHFHIAN